MNSFYCNKRFDISFSNFHKLIKICLPTTYITKETRGIYKQDYMPCNIIEIYDSNTNNLVANIYCWLGQKGLTVLANDELSVSLCIEVLKDIKQNPEEFKILEFKLINSSIILDNDMLKTNYLIYKQLNTSDNCEKYVIKEYNGDEVQVDFYYSPDSLKLSGSQSSLFSIVQLIIEKYLNNSE